ncbi:MAG: dTMP kinase [Thermoleophilia bacterium]|nr:dTMP kinase [Thermoleophilia bacterium]
MSLRFIALEGPDGAGKSVQAALLVNALRARGIPLTFTREPGGTRLGEQVREVVLNPGPTPRSGEADALLFHAARAQNVRENIRPALARGELVVTDRFLWSSRAYQGYGSGVPLHLLDALEDLSCGETRPGLAILVDVPIEVGLERRNRGEQAQMTRFEDLSRHDADFHQRVRDGYLEMAAADPDRWLVIDGDRPVDAIAPDVLEAALRFLADSEPNAADLRMSEQTALR